MKKNVNNEVLDQEWVDLILAALDSGITEQEIRAFLHQTDALSTKVM